MTAGERIVNDGHQERRKGSRDVPSPASIAFLIVITLEGDVADPCRNLRRKSGTELYGELR